MTADDFIAAIQDFGDLSASLQTDLLAFYLLSHAGVGAITASAIESLRTALRLADHARISPYLSESTRKRGKAKPRYVKVKDGYVLERGYSTQLQQTYLGRPAVRHLATSLRGTLAAIGDVAVRSYLEEAVSAFETAHHRGALILTWCVAYGLLRDWLFRNHLAALNGAMAGWKSPVNISRLDDFQELTEGKVIDTARSSGILTREQAKTLKQLLDQRNSYAHPTSKPITPAIVEAYIDTVIREIIADYG
jgi:hypothetical protein